MSKDKRSVQHIKTLSGLLDQRRSRTSSGALLEMSMLEMEKQRLVLEVQRAERRAGEIRARLLEINTKSLRLQKFVEKVSAPPSLSPTTLVPGTPLTVHTMPANKMKSRQLTY
ncbi:MAG: hypothetical protein WCP99_00390 [Burkholderiales bacterium]